MKRPCDPSALTSFAARTGLAAAMLCAVFFQAYSSSALFIDPLRFEITAPAGATYNGTITLRSDRPDPIDVEISFTDDSQGTASWVDLAPRIETLSPQQPTPIPFVVTVPSDAAGEWRGRIGFSEINTNASTAPVTIRTRIAVPIYVIVQGTETYDAEIKAIAVKATRPWTAQIEVENRSNVHVRPKGELVAVDKTDENKVYRMPINSFSYPLLPATTDNLLAKDDVTELPPGVYRLTASIFLLDREITYSTDYQAP